MLVSMTIMPVAATPHRYEIAFSIYLAGKPKDVSAEEVPNESL